MKKIVIAHQNPLVLATISALNSSIIGQGIKLSHNFKLTRGKENSQLEIWRKDYQPIQPIDFFMLGYFIGRDYEF